MMRFLSADECREYCEQRGAPITVLAQGHGGAFSQCFEIALPTAGLDVVGTALEFLSDSLVRDGDHLLWLRTYDIWSEEYEALGGCIWERIVAGLGAPNSSLGATRGVIFTRDDALDAGALLTTLMLFQWDGVIISDDAELLVTVSHDAYVRIASRHRNTSADRFQALADWHPRELATSEEAREGSTKT